MIYMDNHATTRVDPRVVDAMLPWFDVHFGNAGSVTHVLGRQAKQAVDDARARIAACLNAAAEEIVFTSGATESNNLALRGVLEPWRSRHDRRHAISVVTEHRAVLDPLRRLERHGVDVSWLPVQPQGSPDAGRVDIPQLQSALRAETVLVSVMWANNEIGVLQPIREIAQICQSRNVLVHCDATQAVGKIPVDLDELPVDLMSFSAHKMYGPKGIGALYIRQKRPRIRVQPLMDGGGQEFGLRSGTLNVPGIVGFCHALELAVAEMGSETGRVRSLRDDLWRRITQRYGDQVALNGPDLADPDRRLAGNLNVMFRGIQGETLMMHMPELAVSSGSACTAADPAPSHVLRSLGLTEDDAKSSLRFGLGRFNSLSDVERADELLQGAIARIQQQR